VPQLRISVTEILGRPGEYRELDVRPAFEDVQTELARVEARPVRARLKAESVVEGILVSGPATADASLTCARCLERFDAEISLDVCELFAAPGHVFPEEEAYKVEGSEIDLEPMMRDALVLALPLNPICSEDCKGLCGICGQNFNNGSCECRVDETDPRWAGLEALRERLNG
jgi:uncharacterized protein